MQDRNAGAKPTIDALIVTTANKFFISGLLHNNGVRNEQTIYATAIAHHKR